MEKVQFTKAQVAFMLNCQGSGSSIKDLILQIFKRIKKLEKENDQLKRLVADLTLEKESLKNRKTG